MTVIAYRRFKAYVAYKIVSWELFQDVKGKDLSNLETWSLKERQQYHRMLIEGYVRNKRCHDLRVAYRECFVPVAEQDEKHERAIQAAGGNMQRYETLLSELYKRMEELKISEANEPVNGGEPATNSGRDARNGGQRGKKKATSQKGKPPVVEVGTRKSWKQDWTKLLDEAEATGEREASDLYESVYKRQIDSMTRLDPSLSPKLMETIAEVMIAAHSDLYSDAKLPTLNSWKTRTEQAAQGLRKKTDIELDAALRAAIANVREPGGAAAVTNDRRGHNTSPGQDEQNRLIPGLAVPDNIAATLQEKVDIRFKVVTEEDIRIMRGGGKASAKADAYVLRILMIHLAMRCINSVGNFQLSTLSETAHTLLAYLTLRDAKQLEDIIHRAALPAWEARTIFSSDACVVANLPKSLPDMPKTGEAMTKVRFQRLLVLRLSKFMLRPDDQQALFIGKLLLKAVAGKAEWGNVVWDPRAFLLDVHGTDVLEYRRYWPHGLALALHTIDGGEAIVRACCECLTNAQSRLLQQFPDLDRLRRPWTLSTKELAEVRERRNPLESDTFLERLAHRMAKETVKGLLVDRDAHSLVDVPVPLMKSDSNQLVADFFVQDLFPSGWGCHGWTRDGYSARTDGFYVYVADHAAADPAAGSSINDYASRLCGREVMGDTIFIVYVVWKDGERCIADLPQSWPEMLRTCALRRKYRDDMRALSFLSKS